MTPATITLAVYGSLRKGERLHDAYLHTSSDPVETMIRGRMYSLGAYPACDLTEEGWITTETYECPLDQIVLECLRMEVSAGYEPREVWEFDRTKQCTGRKVIALHLDSDVLLTKTPVTSGDWLSRSTDGCPICGRTSTHLCHTDQGKVVEYHGFVR